MQLESYSTLQEVEGGLGGELHKLTPEKGSEVRLRNKGLTVRTLFDMARKTLLIQKNNNRIMCSH